MIPKRGPGSESEELSGEESVDEARIRRALENGGEFSTKHWGPPKNRGRMEIFDGNHLDRFLDGSE